MILIIGGAFQGKKAFAKSHFPNVEWIDGKSCKKEEIFQAGACFHLEEYIRNRMLEQGDLTGFTKELVEKNPQCILICNEVGYGIVPMDSFERRYREQVGRIATEIAGHSNKVYRVIAGIKTVIKDD